MQWLKDFANELETVVAPIPVRAMGTKNTANPVLIYQPISFPKVDSHAHGEGRRDVTIQVDIYTDTMADTIAAYEMIEDHFDFFEHVMGTTAVNGTRVRPTISILAQTGDEGFRQTLEITFQAQ